MLRRLTACALLLLVPVLAFAQAPVPKLEARVTDLTGALDQGTRARIETRLAALERDKGSQVAVLLVPSTQPETIEQFSIRVVDAWKLGREEVDDGALLLVAKDDRTLRIEVGQGLEGAIPDAIAKRVIEETILPRLRQGDFAGGVEAGVDRLVGLVRGEALPPPQPGSRPQERASNALPMFFAILVGGMALRSLLGRLPGAGLAAGGSFLLGMLLLGSAVLGLVAAAIVFLIVLLADGRGGGYRGGGGFGGLGGGFGGGGFSGGGGGFSGGGASGRW